MQPSIGSKGLLSFHLLPLPNIAAAHPRPQPVAPPREANLKLQAALERATKARKLSIQLKGVDYAKELSDQRLKNAASMESLYMELNGILTSQPVDRKKMKAVLAQLEPKNVWFEKAEASAAGILGDK